MKTRQIFKVYVMAFVVVCGIAMAFASCANEDVAQDGTDMDNKGGKILTTFVAGEPETRTSMDYVSGKFYWEEGDKIYVKDDNNTWQVSNAVDAAHAHSTSFRFKVPGKFINSTTYKVYYLGQTGSYGQASISNFQTQTTPNMTTHFNASGDCGVADATGGGGYFSFKLDHQVAILVFQPYTANAILKDCYLTKVEVEADDDIAGYYAFDPTTGELTGSGYYRQIVLTTKDPVAGSANEKGFSLTNATTSTTADKIYMIIKPGTHVLKVRYWIKDYATHVEGTITKSLSSFHYAKDTYYDMTASLDVPNYDVRYYMWDAQNNYWAGHEWDAATPWQPTLNTQPANPNYPKSGDALGRYYNESFPGYGISNPATTPHFVSLPNANELAWYVMKGNPRWDGDELWTSMGHLYKSGMWFKKKAKIPNFTNAHIPDATTDFRTVSQNLENNSLNPSLPSASEINDYFYIPSLGFYYNGDLTYLGVDGVFWSSTADPEQPLDAYMLVFSNGQAKVFHGNGSGSRQFAYPLASVLK